MTKMAHSCTDHCSSGVALCRTRRRRLLSQFDDLQQCYLRLRNPKKRSAQPWVQSHQPALKEQPAKRVKQEPEMGLQGPSDSASSDPLSGAHPTGPSPAGHLHEQQPTGPSPAGHLHQQQPTGPSPAGHLHQQQFNGVDSADPQHGLPNRNMAPPAPVKTGKPLTGNGAALPGAAPASDHVGSGYGVLPSLVVTTAPGLEPGQGAGAEGKPQPAVPDQQHADVVGPADEEGLAEFSRMLSVFTHCARLKVTAQLPRTSNAHCSNILSSIEFDRDGEVTFTRSYECMAVCSMVTSCSFIYAALEKHVAVSHNNVLDVFAASIQHCACGACIASTDVPGCI